LAGLVALWSTNPPRLHVAKIPIGVATNEFGEWGATHPYVRSGRYVLDSYPFPISVEPFTPVKRDTPSPRPPASATTMLAPTVMQEPTLSHNEFALCLQSFLRPSSALSVCEFATCMQALIPPPVPACLPLLPRLSLAPSPSQFESLYMRVLTPTHVPADTEIAERGRSVLVMRARYRSAGLTPHQRGWTDAGWTVSRLQLCDGPL